MAISLYDHERRMEDLQAALEALWRLVVESGKPLTGVVTEAARKLRVNDHGGAAALLEGAAVTAAYRK
jgi:hypothetical protein